MSGKTLTRADLAEAVFQKVGLPRNESAEIVELVLREIISVQKLAARFFEWLVNTDLALAGINLRASVRFDNDRVNSVLEKYRAEREASDRVIELFKAGLLSREEAREKINERID